MNSDAGGYVMGTRPEPQRGAVPVPGHGERKMSLARRPKHGSENG
jgi:hypothetical protein